MKPGEVDEDPILERETLGETSTIVIYTLSSLYMLTDTKENKAEKRPGILGLTF